MIKNSFIEYFTCANAPQEVDFLRVRLLKEKTVGQGSIVYWMSRDQRVHDNWALLYAQQLAFQYRKPLIIIFSIVPSFLQATIRQYAFMIKGLLEINEQLKKYNIPLIILQGIPSEEIPLFVKKNEVALIVTDFDPLKIKRKWKNEIKTKVDIPIYEVDAHNIVPCWLTSNKQEYGAYTIRPKILNQLSRFLTEFSQIKYHPYNAATAIQRTYIYDNLINNLTIDFSVPEVDWIFPGEKNAFVVLNNFINEKLSQYHLHKNDPTKNYQSNLSPYIHFGQISAQRVALEILKYKNKYPAATNAYLDELIIRRELSDNFCFYNNDYDTIKCSPSWAFQSIKLHEKDKREFLYNIDAFEDAKTHDNLWNAAQKEMIFRGKMHGYMRMYWAKKILEWTATAEDAFKIAVYLNDKYQLDGRDPNGYAGVAWSICGVHDRPWFERPIFGKIRYMSYNGCASKFDVNAYIKHFQ